MDCVCLDRPIPGMGSLLSGEGYISSGLASTSHSCCNWSALEILIPELLDTATGPALYLVWHFMTHAACIRYDVGLPIASSSNGCFISPQSKLDGHVDSVQPRARGHGVMKREGVIVLAIA